MAAKSELSIGELAAATGVAPGTLRMWEARHGFPVPVRHGSGDRRYDAADAARVTRVMRERRRGLSLPAAIERVRTWSPSEPATPFSALRGQQPAVAPRRLPLEAMLALSRAIEDECLSRAARPLLAATFQTEAAYRLAEHRWRELARTATIAFVLAEFPRRRTSRGGPSEIPLDTRSPASREWAVVCVDERFTACLAGWEQPSDDGRRSFEAVWSTDGDTCTAVLRNAAAFGGRQIASRVDAALEELSLVDAGDNGATLALANRMLAYLAAALP